ncbi:hypothetical protein LEL_00769 [Akanthomyces lecanii RCEF 1005]|uniref:Uncharacterized protein n=1 Tax=Akanthomyces lecanii RCEF 1005 TaxID=1081108 RepID=A0A168K4K7_CORDF|nr:hypothetical protein LEL_00769 [Akanthomyces lecanii RCEF 1005]
MASLHQRRAASGLSHDSTHSSKIRGRTIVKPILKKLNSHSTSERGSFDLDHAWDDQPSPLSCPSGEYESVYSDGTPALTPGAYDVSAAGAHGDAWRPRDVSFSTSASVEHPTWRSKSKYSHMRSTSGTSHTSSIATNVSARNGTFVHPFQQTPRTATPSLSYANSIASLDISAPVSREYASITEDDSLISPTTATNLPPRAASLTKPASFPTPPPPYSSNSRFRGPSLDESHPSLTLSEGTQTPGQIPTSRSNSVTTAMYMPEYAAQESALSATAPLQMAPISASMSSSGTPTSPSPLSPLRNSLDISGFRLRARSEVDTRTHQEQVREARRKFQEKEKAKEEKYARQQLRRRERDAQTRVGAKIRKSTTSSTSTAKSTAASSRHATDEYSHEKPDFANTGAYDFATAGQSPARADEVQFQRPQRRKTAKHKTNGVWTAFMLWLRTRLLRMGKH